MATERKTRPASWWTSQTRFQKIAFIVSAIISVIVLLFAALVLSLRELGLTNLSDAFFGPGVSGWQWLGTMLRIGGLNWLSTLMVVGLMIMAIFFVNLIIGLITWRGKRSKTIGSLIKSLFRYLVFIIGAGFILSVWGVDIGSIVAGLGVITLIIGLGCQSLIADIVAGLFLVFDDFFDVGDIVIIDSFRGTITELGLRATKLTDWAGNIKSINNSSITTVVNLSREKTTFIFDFTIDGQEDVERAEAIFYKELPNIAHALPMVIGDIEYRGVSGLDENGVQFAFLAASEEANRFQVIRDIRRELYLLMRRNGIKVPFRRVYVKEEGERETTPATEEQKADAAHINEGNRRSFPSEAHRKAFLAKQEMPKEEETSSRHEKRGKKKE